MRVWNKFGDTVVVIRDINIVVHDFRVDNNTLCMKLDDVNGPAPTWARAVNLAGKGNISLVLLPQGLGYVLARDIIEI